MQKKLTVEVPLTDISATIDGEISINVTGLRPHEAPLIIEVVNKLFDCRANTADGRMRRDVQVSVDTRHRKADEAPSFVIVERGNQ